MPAGPLAAANEIDAFDEPARRGEDQCPRQVGRRFREHPRRVGHENPAHLGRHEVDVVVAHGAIRDDPQSRKVL